MVISCILSPYLLAFGSESSRTSGPFVLDQIMNAFFVIDIILNYFTAYYDDDMGIVDDHRVRYPLTY